jgi:hypothetical protein
MTTSEMTTGGHLLRVAEQERNGLICGVYEQWCPTMALCRGSTAVCSTPCRPPAAATTSPVRGSTAGSTERAEPAPRDSLGAGHHPGTLPEHLLLGLGA